MEQLAEHEGVLGLDSQFAGPQQAITPPKQISWLERLRLRLARVTTPGREFLPEIDGLRFIAIAAVVLYHTHDHLIQRHPAIMPWREDPGWGYWLLQSGHIGVELFFVLSGFILALPFARHYLADGRRVKLGAYYLRRLTRLEPPYLINLVIFFLLFWLVRGDALREMIGPLAASATYTHNVVYSEASKINFVAWSLEIEAQFYLLAPLLALLFTIPHAWLRRTSLLVTAMLCGAISLWLDQRFGSAMPLTLIRFLPLFIGGLFLADLYIVGGKSKQTSSWAGDIAAAIGMIASLAIVQYPAWRWATALPLAMVVGGALWGRLLHVFVNRPWIATMGGMCYTIYLYHFVLITAVARPLRSVTLTDNITLNFLFQALVLIVPMLLASMALFVCFEKPFMQPNWLRHLLGTRPKLAAQPVS